MKNRKFFPMASPLDPANALGLSRLRRLKPCDVRGTSPQINNTHKIHSAEHEFWSLCWPLDPMQKQTEIRDPSFLRNADSELKIQECRPNLSIFLHDLACCAGLEIVDKTHKEGF